MERTPGTGVVSRRDFINGVLVSSSGMLGHGLFSPEETYACATVGQNVCDGSIGRDRRAQRGGNVPSAFSIAHWMRDQRLTFGMDSVTLAPGPCDPTSGTYSVKTDNGSYDVIITGSGISALSAAFFILRQRPGTRILMLDVNPSFGRNAGRDDAAPIPAIAATGGAYAVTPYADFLLEFYGRIGIDWSAHYVPDPFYCYYFDDRCGYSQPGSRGWARDVYGTGLKDMPYSPEIIQDLQKAKQDFRNWYDRHGSPTDPADNTDPRYDYLAQMTLDQYFTSKGYHPAVSDFYTRYSVDALAGTAEQVNALTSISFIAAEYHPAFAFPGGTSGIARHALRWLIPGSIQGSTTAEIVSNPIREDRLDVAGNAVRLRQRSLVVRTDTDASGASVVYYRDGQFIKAKAKSVILAGQAHTAHRTALHLLSEEQHEAFCDMTLAPVVTANVTLRRAAPVVDLGLGYDEYWWGSKHWADFVIADWVGPKRYDRDRETVLTFYGGNSKPSTEMYNEREKLLSIPFSEYEDSLRDDMNRILADAGFDFDRDVSAVYIYRWGHGMIYPKVGSPFGPPQNKNGQVVRTLASRHIARQRIGRISIAGQDTESSPALESAIGSGLRTAAEALSSV